MTKNFLWHPRVSPRTQKRAALWPLERAQLALKHEAALNEERQRVESAVAAAKAETSRARQRAMEELTRWHVENTGLVEHIFEGVTHELSRSAAREMARRIDAAWDEVKPEQETKKRMRDTMMSRMDLDVIAMDETTPIVRIRIPPVEVHYAHSFSRLEGFPWAGPRAFR